MERTNHEHRGFVGDVDWGRHPNFEAQISEERRQGAFTFKITDYRFEVTDGEHRPGVLLRNYRLLFSSVRRPGAPRLNFDYHFDFAQTSSGIFEELVSSR